MLILISLAPLWLMLGLVLGHRMARGKAPVPSVPDLWGATRDWLKTPAPAAPVKAIDGAPFGEMKHQHPGYVRTAP